MQKEYKNTADDGLCVWRVSCKFVLCVWSRRGLVGENLSLLIAWWAAAKKGSFSRIRCSSMSQRTRWLVGQSASVSVRAAFVVSRARQAHHMTAPSLHHHSSPRRQPLLPPPRASLCCFQAEEEGGCIHAHDFRRPDRMRRVHSAVSLYPITIAPAPKSCHYGRHPSVSPV